MLSFIIIKGIYIAQVRKGHKCANAIRLLDHKAAGNTTWRKACDYNPVRRQDSAHQSNNDASKHEPRRDLKAFNNSYRCLYFRHPPTALLYGQKYV